MKRPRFERSHFALCEGVDDANVIRELTKSAGIKAFDVSPVNDLGNTNGNSGFEASIIGSSALPGFDGITDVVVVSDNDDDPAASFSQIAAQLARAAYDTGNTANWSLPTAPGPNNTGTVRFSIWMWPDAGQAGCLETLLWQIVQSEYPDVASCVDAALACSGADQWSTSKRDKARIRCFIGISNQKNPGLPLGLVWRDQPDLFPITHNAFDPVREFLKAL
jgi:hypothetical protein